MFDQEYKYSPTELDDEAFLSDLPIDLIISSIETQFDSPLEYRKIDYVQTFINKYNLMKENDIDEDDNLENFHDEFFRFIEQIFQDKLSIGFPNIDDMNDDDQCEMVHLTYRFFIKFIKKNFVNLIKNYIKENPNEITSTYEKKKDVTTINFKAEIDNDYDILVLSYLGNIIEDVLEQFRELDDVNEFLDYCQSDEYILELAYVKKSFNNMTLTGNFIPKYIDMIDDEFKVEIESKVRNSILKKYPKRKKNKDEETDATVSEE